ncbi:hypothetical protein RND71_012240 [Anisodus tanguticus]|uniref:Uncharacterized protein n=1 Tax=Anisodus tanguticus TaxID=243964 RepID=A0AAE1SFH5_9SOLA|nr:hypothetical protein RND71_012240 [Anisodus tanguticus]
MSGGRVGTMQPWMSLGASLVAKAVDYAVAPLGRQLRYLYQYKKIADNLRKQAERYKQSKVAAKKVMAIQELLGRTPKEDVSILQAPPLNIPFISDQKKPKEDQVIEMVASSSSVVDNGAFLSVDDIAIKQRLTMDPIIAYQLRKNVENTIHQQREVVHQIIEEMQDDHYKARMIQGQIADMLGRRLKEESTLGRAEIGIPHGDEHKACRIMLTTRQKDLCTAMGTKGIPSRLLSEEESLHLLRKNACTSTFNLPRELDGMVMNFVKECEGLPLERVTVGSALRGKGLMEWEGTLQLLKKSQSLSPTYAEKTIFSCLKLSYNFLENEEIRLCFLICCLYPEDREISIEDLTRDGIGKGMFSDVDTVEEARARVCSRVSQLKASCLLLDDGKEGFVKMHDVVLDFAIYIASQEKHGFMVRAGHNLNEWPRRESFSQKTAISFMSNDIHVLPRDVHCPNLQILLLGENEGLEQIPENFFKQMKMLQVLDLSERVGVHSINPRYGLVPNATSKITRPLRFPSSINVLTNLRTLRLDRCKLGDVSILGRLKSLEILSLYVSSIRELPNEFGDLVNLRLLDLSFCQYLQKIPENLISRLVQLEELYMGGSFKLWQLADGSVERSGQASLSELMSLPHLNILCVRVSTLLAFSEIFDLPSIHKGFKSLENLEITANEDITYLVDEVLHSEAPVTLGALEKLHLRNLKKLCLLSACSIEAGSFQNLRILKVDLFHDLIHLLGTSLLQRLSSIEEVHVYSCNKLFTIFHLDKAAFDEEQKLLSTLKRIQLHRLPWLSKIWKICIPVHGCSNLCQLDSLKIVGCHRLERIIGEPPEGMSENIQNGHVLFPNLRDVHVESCSDLRNLFLVMTAQSLGKLEELKVNEMSNLVKLISIEESEREEEKDKMIVLPELKSLRVTKSQNVERLCSEAFIMDLPSLEEFVLLECPKMADTIKHGLGSASSLLKVQIEEQSFIGTMAQQVFSGKIHMAKNLFDLRKS